MFKIQHPIRVIRKYSQYKATVHLPQTSFPLNVRDKAKHEEELQQICKFDALYEWQLESLKNKSLFVLHDGPPYANGNVHVGHALNKVLKDITNRYKLLQSYQIHYKPGWDCHGLPIEIKALKSKNFNELSALEIRQKAKTFAEKTIDKHKNAFKRWGILADWNNSKNCYFTFDPSYEEAELLFFHEMYKKNLIYRDLKPIYWSPSSVTALAESELEYNSNHVSKSLYTLFPILSSSFFPKDVKSVAALVWTTQPWTLPANQALCYNPDISYSFVKIKDCLCLVATDTIPQISNELGVVLEVVKTIDASQLQGVVCAHPMDSDRHVKLFPAAHVTTQKGSGIVHTAPAHGLEDFTIGQKHSLDVKSNIDKYGCFTADSGFNLDGKYIFKEGNSAVLDILDQKGNLVSVNDFIHSYPYDWRTKKEIFVQTSQQWFIDTNQLKEKAKTALEEVQFYPSNVFERMKSVLESRTFWCISRQRVWGVPIPVFYNKNDGSVLINDSTINHIRSLIKQHGSDVWFSSSIDTLLPESVLRQSGYDGTGADFMAGTDILDIWFDSGVSWASVLGNGNTGSMPVADMYLEGKDQFNGWFQSSLLTSIALQGRAPYKTLFSHGFCVAEDGRKMSKSLGNVIDPMLVVNGGKNRMKQPCYGADGLRWMISQSNPMSEIHVSKSVLDDAANSVQKVRACLRYLLSNLHGFNTDLLITDHNNMQPVDQYFCHQLINYIDQITQDYNNCAYSQAAHAILNYTTDISSVYFSIIKDRLYCEDGEGDLRRSAQTAMYFILEALVKSVAPILPHLAEETMLHHPCPKSSSAFKDGWFRTDDLSPLIQPSTVHAVGVALQLRAGLLQHLTDRKVAQTTSYDVTVFAPSNLITSHLQTLQDSTSSRDSSLSQVLTCAQSTLTTLDHVSWDLDLKEVEIDVEDVKDRCVVAIKLSDDFRCPRCRKHTSQSNGQLCGRCTLVLSHGWDS